MEDFFNEYYDEIIKVLIILSIMAVAMVLTSWTFKKISDNAIKNKTNAPLHALKLVRRILNALWLVLGVMVLVLIIFGTKDLAESKQHFKITLYLGLVSVFTIVLASSINVWFVQSIERKIRYKEDPTSYKFLRYVAVFTIYMIGALFCLLAFPSLKVISQTALGGAGVLALIAGVSSQEALSNLVGGVFIIAFKPFRIGDTVQIGETMVGKVTDITLRHTVLTNFSNKMIVIPNSIINKEKLINFDLHDPKICERIEIGISYQSNVQLAKKIIQEECEKHKYVLDARTDKAKQLNAPIVRVALISINESSVTVRAWVWAKNFDDAFDLRCDVLESIKLRFENEGIELPFPSRTIYVSNDEKSKLDPKLKTSQQDLLL